jgi:hypothetical protein
VICSCLQTYLEFDAIDFALALQIKTATLAAKMPAVLGSF